MTLSRSFSCKAFLFCLACLLFTPGCAGTAIVPPAPPGTGKGLPIAVLPVDNMAGFGAPLDMIRASLEKAMLGKGFHVMPDKEVYKVMAAHLMRDTGGINREMSRAFKKAGAGAVLITYLEFFDRGNPPRVALAARLVATGSQPRVLWMNTVSAGGADSPGLFLHGMVHKAGQLMNIATGRLCGLLLDALSGIPAADTGPRLQWRFKPRSIYAARVLKPGKKYRIVVAPFYNISRRRGAGRYVQYAFMQQLLPYRKIFEVVEPGLIRHEFLNLRIIMWDGISLVNAGKLFDMLHADLIISGRVLKYQDRGDPAADFQVIMIKRKNRRVVWSSESSASGNEDVYFYNLGRVSTANSLASEMAREAVKAMLEKEENKD